jgi:hypothetical protein
MNPTFLLFAFVVTLSFMAGSWITKEESSRGYDGRTPVLSTIAFLIVVAGIVLHWFATTQF